MSWQNCTLGDVVKLQRGHDLPERLRVDGPIPIVSSSGITGRHNVAKAEPPGVVTGRYGTIGEVFFLEEPYWPLNTALYVVDFKGNNPRFAAYLLRNTLKNYQSEKAAVPGVDRNVLHLLKVRAPDRQLQERIVSVLSAYDDLIENNRRRIALLEEVGRMLYREWFVRFRFPGHEHVKIIDGLPEGWERRPFGQIAVLNYGKALKEENRLEGTFPVYGSSGVVGSHQVALVEGPTIVIGRKGNVGSIYWAPTNFWPIDTVYFISKGQADFWLYLALPSAGFQNTDAGVPGLNREFAYSRELICPTPRLRQLFNEAVEPMFVQRTTLENYNSKLAQARDLLLPRLMNGEITV
ncbi:restriction endonuclease subunit S [Bradyrhizobium sp. C-145]|uniref:restriction endonuclease subunit S n=1 Tax=Bradyrhizobium sp. C-145 TaxID=574727 RepID=UPI00201B4821|nr:restriction endonuclease subunit S [Bradyrhizobium sp. C-145]UQR66241.1 restriction endonuclease subunit S [Bradyrhizobium sp. C-145]